MRSRTQCWFFFALIVWSAPNFAGYAAQSVKLAWQPSLGTQVAGYYVYCGSASGVYTNKVNTGTNTAFTMTGLKEGATYYFSASAYNSNGVESALTPEITYVVPGVLTLSPATIQGTNSMRIQFPVAPSHQYALQMSVDLQNWTNVWVTPVESTNGWVEYDEPRSNSIPKKFYRLVMY